MRTKKRHSLRRRQRGGAFGRVPDEHITEREFIETNRLLNYCDCFKDAAGLGKNRLFLEAVKSLFPGNQPIYPDKAIGNIEEEIFSNKKYGPEPEKICWLRDNKSSAELRRSGKKIYNERDENTLTISKLPEIVKYAFHDSGFSPTGLNPEIIQILTPGSYIDPAKRAKEDEGSVVVKGTGIKVERDVFEMLGFLDAVQEVEGKKDGGAMEIKITLADGEIFTTKRTKQHKHSGTTTRDYFLGNKEKKGWFDENSEKYYDEDIKKEAKKFILFKELGDTLQVIYARIIMDEPSLEYCMFTIDDVVAVRCRELGVPVCVQRNQNNEYANIGITYYYTPLIDKEAYDTVIKTSYIDQCVKHNNQVLFSVLQILAEGYFYLDDTKTFIPTKDEDPLRKFFKTIARSIESETKFIDGSSMRDSIKRGHLHGMSLQYLKGLVAENTAVNIINGLKINKSIAKLFPSDHTNDPIFNTGQGRNLYEIIKDLKAESLGPVVDPKDIKRRRLSRGGGKEEEEKEEDEEEVSPTQEFYNVTVKLLKQEYEIPGDEILHDMAYEFLCIMYVFLNYIGDTPTNEEILTHYIHLYIKGELQGFTIKEFARDYNDLDIIKRVNEFMEKEKKEAKEYKIEYEEVLTEKVVQPEKQSPVKVNHKTPHYKVNHKTPAITRKRRRSSYRYGNGSTLKLSKTPIFGSV